MSSPISIKAVLFDLDGTIIDSEKTACNVIEQCFSEWNLKFESRDAEAIVGRTWDLACEYLFSKFTPPMPAEDAKRLISERYRAAIHEHLPCVPEAPEAIGRLAAGFPLALVSGSYRQEILFALERLRIAHHFKVVYGAEDYPRSKPHPDGYLKALATLGVAPHEAVVFEDSEAGIASARAAGLWVVAVSAANHFGHDHAGAHHVIEDFRGVDIRWMNALPSRMKR